MRHYVCWQFIEVNGMRLTEPHRAYCHILSELTGNKATPDHAALLLDKRFSEPGGRRQPTLLMVDEVTDAHALLPPRPKGGGRNDS